MDLVLTLIAAPGRTKLTQKNIKGVRNGLDRLGGETSPADWLADGKACDIGFSNITPGQAVASALAVLGDENKTSVDAVATVRNGRKKRILVADMDSTIVTGETLDELADFAGIKKEIAKITERAMRGEIGFEEAIRERVARLAGLGEDALEKTMKRIKLTPGAKCLVATMKANGARAILVSGGFSFFTDRVRDDVGFDASHGNRLGIKNGTLDGKVIDPILGKDAKLEILMKAASENNVPLGDVLAIGDGANDVPMLGAAGMGIAFHAHPIAASAARSRLDHADLRGVLFAQGYREDEFVEP